MKISEYEFPIGYTLRPNNARQCTVSPSINVEEGDIIGISVSSVAFSAFRLYFMSLSSFTSYILDSASDTTFSVPGSTCNNASVQPACAYSGHSGIIYWWFRFVTVPYIYTVTETTTSEPTTQAPTQGINTRARRYHWCFRFAHKVCDMWINNCCAYCLLSIFLIPSS